MSEPDPIELTIPLSHAGDRLDRVLAVLRPDVSRSTFQRWFKDERVRISGEPVAAKHRASGGELVHIQPAHAPQSNALPQDIPLSILYEDTDLVVLDKPAGLVVHPAPGHPDGTLVNALVHRYGVLPSSEDELDDGSETPEARLRPGIVHRLDRDTSGVMVVARTPGAREGLMRLFASHDIDRAYTAIALGEVPERVTFDTLHGRHPRDRKRFSGKVIRGKRAVTHVERLESMEGASLVRCRLETGRTHQIRVHLSEAGHPLLGDTAYGKPPSDLAVKNVGLHLGRQALHASVLGFEHPITGQKLRFESALPPDIQAALDTIRSLHAATHTRPMRRRSNRV